MSERHALLAALDARCVRPGRWEVNGHRLDRHVHKGTFWTVDLPTSWLAAPPNEPFVSFDDALRFVAATEGIEVPT
jgi:hypothetical protein